MKTFIITLLAVIAGVLLTALIAANVPLWGQVIIIVGIVIIVVVMEYR